MICTFYFADGRERRLNVKGKSGLPTRLRILEKIEARGPKSIVVPPELEGAIKPEIKPFIFELRHEDGKPVYREVT